MNLSELKAHVIFQSNNDIEDIEDFEPHILEYLNEAYDRLIMAWAKSHADYPGDPEQYPKLEADTDVPKTPEWTHRYLADWATWLIYRNGNPQKQQRGYAYRESFERMLATVADEGGERGLDEDGKRKRFRNFFHIPV